jgi:hypothetical protein
MKKLLKIYGLNSDMQYFQMCIESKVNGQIQQAKDQFKALPRTEKKAMVRAMFTHWSIDQDIALFFYDQL